MTSPNKKPNRSGTSVVIRCLIGCLFVALSFINGAVLIKSDTKTYEPWEIPAFSYLEGIPWEILHLVPIDFLEEDYAAWKEATQDTHGRVTGEASRRGRPVTISTQFGTLSVGLRTPSSAQW
jgi:hypothetical protein